MQVIQWTSGLLLCDVAAVLKMLVVLATLHLAEFPGEEVQIEACGECTTEECQASAGKSGFALLSRDRAQLTRFCWERW